MMKKDLITNDANSCSNFSLGSDGSEAARSQIVLVNGTAASQWWPARSHSSSAEDKGVVRADEQFVPFSRDS
jgi:hypothetical protein